MKVGNHYKKRLGKDTKIRNRKAIRRNREGGVRVSDRERDERKWRVEYDKGKYIGESYTLENIREKKVY